MITIENAQGIKIRTHSHDPDEDKALAAIGAAISAAESDIDSGAAPDADSTQLEQVAPPAPPAPEPAPAAEDPDAPKSPTSEVDNLMAKYDNDEKQAAYVKSDAYKNKIKAKADKEISK